MGVKDSATEKIVGNAPCVFTVHSIRRKSREDRCNLELLQPQATREMKFQKDLLQQSWAVDLQSPWHASSGSRTEAEDIELLHTKKIWRSMDSQLDAQPVVEIRLEGGAILKCAEVELRSA